MMKSKYFAKNLYVTLLLKVVDRKVNQYGLLACGGKVTTEPVRYIITEYNKHDNKNAYHALTDQKYPILQDMNILDFHTNMLVVSKEYMQHIYEFFYGNDLTKLYRDFKEQGKGKNPSRFKIKWNDLAEIETKINNLFIKQQNKQNYNQEEIEK